MMCHPDSWKQVWGFSPLSYILFSGLLPFFWSDGCHNSIKRYSRKIQSVRRGEMLSGLKVIKRGMVGLSMVMMSIPASIYGQETPCKPALYDEAYVAYSQAFHDKFKLERFDEIPKENIQEMPEYLQFIEMVIRSEFGNPRCYLNFAIDNRPDVFKFSNNEFHAKTFESSISRYIAWALSSGQTGYKIAKNSIFSEIISKNNKTRQFVFVKDFYPQKDFIYVQGGISCSLQHYRRGNNEKPSVLQIEKANSEIRFRDIKDNHESRNKFFHTISFPEKWYETVNNRLREVNISQNKYKKCSGN